MPTSQRFLFFAPGFLAVLLWSIAFSTALAQDETTAPSMFVTSKSPADPGLAIPSADPHNPELKEIRSLLNRAHTWYWWARGSENTKELHDLALRDYKRAMAKAEQLPENIRKKWVDLCQSGIDQSAARIDNAHDTFRTVFEPVWWLLGEDRTIEAIDDEYMRALGNVWENMAIGTLDSNQVGNHLVVARARYGEFVEKDPKNDAGAALILELLRDEALTHADGLPKMVSITDDMGRAVLEDEWDALIASDGFPVGVLAKLGEGLESPNLMILDIIVTDEIDGADGYLPGVRINLMATLWDAEGGEHQFVLNDCAVSGTVVDRYIYQICWFAGLFFLAILLALASGGVRAHRQRQGKTLKEIWLGNQRLMDAVLGLIAFIVGGALGYVAGEVSASFKPVWADVSFHLDERTGLHLPLLGMMAWPLVHGFVVMLGPIAVCVWASQKFLRTVAEQLGVTVDIGVVIPSAQAGALAYLFAPLVLFDAVDGINISLWLSAAGMACCIAAAQPVSAWVNGESLNGRIISSATLSTLPLLFLLPVGLYNSSHVGMSGVAMACAIPALWWGWSRTETVESTTAHASIERSATGTLEYPDWVVTPERKVNELVGHLLRPGVSAAVVTAEAGLGRTRFLEEINHRIQHTHPNLLISRVACTPPRSSQNGGNVHTTEPFDAISRALRAIIPLGDLAARESRIQKSRELVSSSEAALAAIPMIGMIIESAGVEEDPNLSRDHIIADVIREVRKLLTRQSVVLLFDDWQWADESSVQTLKRLVAELQEEPPPSHTFGLVLTHESLKPTETPLVQWLIEMEQPPNTTTTEQSVLRIDLHAFQLASWEEFLLAAGVNLTGGLGPDFVSDSHSLCTGNPRDGLSLLRSLLDAGLLTADLQPGGGRRLSLPGAEPLDRARIREHVPDSLVRQQMQWIAALPEQTRLTLECAAVAGHQFTVQAIAQGLNISRLEAANRLRQIEEQTGLIEDHDSHDQFEFKTSLTRDGLMRSLTTGGTGATRSREVMREMHYRLAIYYTEHPQETTPGNIAYHALNAGVRLRQTCLSQAVFAAQQSAHWQAWKDVLLHLETAVRSGASQTQEQQQQLDYLRAKALRGGGGQTNRNDAIALFQDLFNRIESPEHELCGVIRAQILFDYLEALFDEKTTDDVEQIRESCTQWLTAKGDLSDLERGIIEFYQVLISKPGREEEIARFRTLETTLRALKSSRQRDLQLAVILDRLSRLPGPDEQGFFALLDESLKLKEAHHDWHGISINYGARGDYYQFYRKGWHGGELDPTAARGWYDKQDVLAREMGDRAALARVTNKHAGLDIDAAKRSNDPAEAAGHWRKGLERARWSLRVALELQREGDTVFAASNALQAAAGVGDFKAATHAAQAIARREVWQELQLGTKVIMGFITAIEESIERLKAVSEDQQTDEWNTAVSTLQMAATELRLIHKKQSLSERKA